MTKAFSSPVVESKQDLVRYFEEGARHKEQFKVGTEHEKLLYYTNSTSRLRYEGDGGIAAVLKGYVDQFGWAPIYEKDNIIAVQRGKASISLEPAGQFELSGAPLDSLHDTFMETLNHFEEMHALQKELGFSYLGVGMDPFTKREERPWMPKSRYATMRDYMPSKGNLGLDMMTATATIQSNLDYSSEADMVRKFRAGLNLQPLVTALFASSPFTHGQPNGYQSYRAHIWQDTDPDRCGWLPWAFDGEMSYEKYVDYLLDVPMYFALIYNDAGVQELVPATQHTFRQFFDGKLPFAKGQKPTMKAWEYHTACVFPEVRLKQFIEMRGADAGPIEHITALSAFWVGLLYDTECLDYVTELTKGWTQEDRRHLYDQVPKSGLETVFQDKPLKVLVKEVLQMAEKGLKKRGIKNKARKDESVYLQHLFCHLDHGKNMAQELLDAYHGAWQKDLTKIFDWFLDEELACYHKPPCFSLA